MKINHPHRLKRGMSLVEIVIAMTLMAVLALSCVAAMLQTRRISESNIFENTALAVAQGYIEQIKAMDYDALLACEIGNQPLPLRGVTANPDGSTSVTPENLVLDADNAIGFTDASNVHQGVLIDLVRKGNTNTYEPRYMRMWVRPEITNLVPVNNWRCLEVTIRFRWEARDLGPNAIPRESVVRFTRSHVPTY